MLSSEWMQRKNIEYKQKIEELNELCTELKEQLATKELNEYEQEVRIRDLRAQLKELSDVEDKLSLANRNARVLEEENNSLLLKLKSGELERKATSTVRAEAIKLIEENNQLRFDIEELRASYNKAIQREHQLEQKCKNLAELQEKADAQMIGLNKKTLKWRAVLWRSSANGPLQRKLGRRKRQDIFKIMKKYSRPFKGLRDQRNNENVEM
ncbi:uncharacterized protein Tco025E_09813 [Trypanosoma conorhini]|uniref:Uncharacterized protein n=1 Tax=Trypanosoma conorhini TaxID=83891 RepID=A0A3R7KK87_9TRYP|nr:uncharacterized protein Tco025E_09813 [Trypanosoma conorhini]RNE96097.1 hypothetical protein Tco025E_09813 [Trypanosoma conorhini]